MEQYRASFTFSLLRFALDAVAKLHDLSRSLGSGCAPDPFLSMLNPVLSDVHERLNDIWSALGSQGAMDPHIEPRVFRLLVTLESLVRVSYNLISP